MEYVYVICAGLLFFFSFSLLTKKNKPLSEKIFSAWIILLLVTVISFLLYVKSLSRQYPIFITLICDSHLLHGALLYLYLKAFTDHTFRLQKKHLLHLIPMLFLVIAKLLLNFVFAEMECYKEGGCVEDDNIYVQATYLYKYLVLGIYILFAWKIYIAYRKNALSPRDKMRSEWVKQITLGVSFLFTGILLIQLGRYLLPELFWERMLLGNILTTLFIFIFLYIGNSYTYIFVAPSKKRFINLSESVDSNTVSDEQIRKEREQVFRQLEEFMLKEEPYTKGHLTLAELSELSGIHPNLISQSVNTITGKNFNDLINGYRVEKLKTLLRDPAYKNYKIMALADDCGFSSKSTLIRIFKSHTGMTPSEYQKSL